VSSSALNKTKLLQKHTHKRHTKQSSSSDKTSLQNAHTQNQSCLFLLKLIVTQQNKSSKKNTHTHTHRKENQNYVPGSLLLSLNQTQESFHFKSEITKLCHICCTHLLPTQCTKKKAMHDEHIFLLLSHDLQNLAFIFSHQAHEAVSGGRKPLLTQVSHIQV